MRLERRLGLRLVQFDVVALVERDAILRHIHEEVAAMSKPVVHLLQGMADEVDRRANRPGNAVLAHQPVIDLGPALHPVGQALVVDDDEQVIIRLVAFGGVRLVDPVPTRVAAVENDLEDTALLLPFVLGQRKGVLELLEDQLDHAFQFALLVGRQMVEIAAHH